VKKALIYLVVLLLAFTNFNLIGSALAEATGNMAPIELGFTPYDTAVDPEDAVVFMTRLGNKTLYAVNYEKGTIATLTLPYPAEVLEIYAGKLYVSQHKTSHNYYNFGPFSGAIAIVDTKTFTLDEVFDINADPYDIAIDVDGYLYVTPGSGQFEDMKIYSLHDKQEVLNGNKGRMRHLSKVLYNEQTSKLYTTTTEVSPRNVTAFEVDKGIVIVKNRSPYHGDYPMEPHAKISPDGLHLYNGSGYVFKLSKLNTEDMYFSFNLGERYNDFAFSQEEHLTFAASKSGGIDIYQYHSDEYLYSIKDDIVVTKLHFNHGLIAIYSKNNKSYLEFIEDYEPGAPEFIEGYFTELGADGKYKFYDFYNDVQGVPVDTLLSLIFNQPIFIEDESKIELNGPDGLINIIIDDEDGILYVEPDLLNENTFYTLTIKKEAISGMFGDVSERDFTFNFRTIIPPVKSVSISTNSNLAPIQYTFIANSVGGAEPEYQFSIKENNRWVVLQDYGPNHELTWNPVRAGNFEFRVQVRSKGKTKEDIVVLFSQSVVDATKPELTITADNINSTNQEVLLSVVATDHFGIKRIKLPSGQYINSSETTFTVTENGIYSFEAEDFSNNITKKAIQVRNIDKIAPDLTLTPNVTNRTNSNITISVQATDNVKVKGIGLPDGSFIESDSATFTVSKNGTYQFTVEDTAGNTTEKSINISNIDKVKPTLTLLPSTTSATKESIFITITATDNVKVKRITLPNGDYISGTTALYPIEKNGTYTFSVEDTAGNITSKSIKITNIYKNPPARPTVNPIWDKHTVITGKTTPNRTVYAKNGSTRIGSVKSEANGEYSMTIAKQKAGSKITVYAKDPAGNTSTTRVVTVIDKTAPKAPTVNNITTKSKAVTGTAEKGATVHVYRGSTYLNKAIVDSKGNFNIAIPRQKAGRTISVYAVDKANNKSKTTSVKVN
jgi:hypothetical protein